MLAMMIKTVLMVSLKVMMIEDDDVDHYYNHSQSEDVGDMYWSGFFSPSALLKNGPDLLNENQDGKMAADVSRILSL